MNISKTHCFLCEPDAARPLETPWNWDAPRLLCQAHNHSHQLQDGQSLQEVLRRVKPDDAPLEGSQLGWIFNPVFVVNERGDKVRGWADFVAGGMSVLEGRHAAQSYFEFRALETSHGVDALYLFHKVGPAAAKAESFLGFMQIALSMHEHIQQPSSKPSRPFDGLTELTGLWNFQTRLERIRKNTGHLWPESFAELEQWVEQCGDHREKMDAATEAELYRTLVALAARRFQ